MFEKFREIVRARANGVVREALQAIPHCAIDVEADCLALTTPPPNGRQYLLLTALEAENGLYDVGIVTERLRLIKAGARPETVVGVTYCVADGRGYFQVPLEPKRDHQAQERVEKIAAAVFNKTFTQLGAFDQAFCDHQAQSEKDVNYGPQELWEAQMLPSAPPPGLRRLLPGIRPDPAFIEDVAHIQAALHAITGDDEFLCGNAAGPSAMPERLAMIRRKLEVIVAEQRKVPEPLAVERPKPKAAGDRW